MPWCEECAKFWNPTSLPANGACPKCGQIVQSASQTEAVVVDDSDVSVPWHFKLLVALLIAYLGWRAVQAILWVVG